MPRPPPFQVQSGSSGPARASAVVLTSAGSIVKNPRQRQQSEAGTGSKDGPRTHVFVDR